MKPYIHIVSYFNVSIIIKKCLYTCIGLNKNTYNKKKEKKNTVAEVRKKKWIQLCMAEAKEEKKTN